MNGEIMEQTNKKIVDIRLFSSDRPNINGQPLPNNLPNRAAAVFAQRVAKKLWEAGFVLGDYTHLYIDYNASCTKNGFAARSDAYHRWYRFYEYGIDGDLTDAPLSFFADSMKSILVKEYAGINNVDIASVVDGVLREGENTEIEYKRTINGEYAAVITIRIADSGAYLPKVTVYRHGAVLATQCLPPSYDTQALGRMILTKHQLTVAPKNSANHKKTVIKF